MAIKSDDLDMVKCLIAEGVDINKIDDSSGMAYLSYAIQHRCWDIVKHLIGKKSKINSTDRDTMKTHLHHAVETSDADIILLLIKKKAATNVKDKDKHTPLDYANEIGDTCIIEILVAEKYRQSKLEQEEMIEYLSYLKEACIENDEEYNENDEEYNDCSLDINKLDEVIRMLGYLDCTKIRIGETLYDDSRNTTIGSGFSDISARIYYEEKYLCTITEKRHAPLYGMSFEYKSVNIDISDLFTELCDKMGATGCI